MTTGDSLKAALYTALFTFVALFAVSLIGWVDDVAEWAKDDGVTIEFPDPSVLIKASFAAAAAALSGLLNFVVRWAQGHLGWGEVPTYKSPPPPPDV
jgi:hypothetical protein